MCPNPQPQPLPCGRLWLCPGPGSNSPDPGAAPLSARPACCWPRPLTYHPRAKETKASHCGARQSLPRHPPPLSPVSRETLLKTEETVERIALFFSDLYKPWGKNGRKKKDKIDHKRPKKKKSETPPNSRKVMSLLYPWSCFILFLEIIFF